MALTKSRSGNPSSSGKNYAGSIQSSRANYASPRQVYVNIPLPSDQLDPRKFAKGRYRPKQLYCTNRIRTSKYTVWSFLPKNLFEQFRRVANFYFLMLIILQAFPEYKTIDVGLAALPIMFIVAVTAVKDGLEDYRRWRQDNIVNERKTLVLGSNGWRNYNYSDKTQKSIPQRVLYQFQKFLKGDSAANGDLLVEKAASGNANPAAVAPANPAQDHPLQPQSPTPTVTTLGSIHSSQMNQPHYQWLNTQWQSLRVGDIIYLKNDEPIPADVIVLSTSEPDCMCYVETKNLDGETNLKLKQGPIETSSLSTPDESARRLKVIVDSEAPTTNMLRYQATLNLFGDYSAVPANSSRVGSSDLASSKQTVTSGGGPHDTASVQQQNSKVQVSGSIELSTAKKVPVDINGILMRGSVLRNTKWVIGIVIYTGEDTKQIMNSGKTPSKRSQMEKLMNIHVALNLAFMLILCLIGAICYTVWLQRSLDGDTPYIQFASFSPVGQEGFVIFWACLLLFQNIVPISLYISIEIVKTIQALFIHSDLELYYEVNDTSCSARSWNLSDNLGQIEYIFSDKTGTLTRNIMEFKKCAINGLVFDGKKKSESSMLSPNHFSRASMSARSLFSFKAAWLEGNHESIAKGHSRNVSLNSPPTSPKGERPSSMISYGGAGTNDLGSAEQQQQELEQPPGSWFDESLQNFLWNPSLINTTQGIITRDFFTLLSVCHTVLVDEKIEKEVSPTEIDGVVAEDVVPIVETTISYKAQSPDEACLVTLAAETGFIFKGRFYNTETMQNEISVEILGKEERFALLNILEFDSDRKRMSVIVRPLTQKSNSNDVIVFCKGADSVIYERLLPGQNDMMEKTTRILESFAEEGLRTLCLAYSKIPGNVYEQWSARYSEAMAVVYPDPSFRARALDALNTEVEKDLVLLGATAIEDKLQEGVPECIRTLATAGIKIWVLTGDKVETAINVGFLCGLLKSGEANIDDLMVDLDSEMILIQIKNAKDSWDMHRQMLSALEQFWGVDGNGNELPMAQMISPRKRRKEHALIIDGQSLKFALENEDMTKCLLDLGCRCKAVICCRVSPLQKAKVVEMVKHGKRVLTLAIGDGANDVSMIQAADVGVGISGEEGLQAAISADYAIAQFKFLKRLLLVHGRWSYSRMSFMILNFYLKSIVITLVLFWFQFDSGFTAGVVYDFSYLLLFNLVFTSLPIMVLAILDQDIDQKLCLKMPQIYGTEGIQKTFYTHRLFLLYVLDSIWFSLVCYYMPAYTYSQEYPSRTGQTFNMYHQGTLMAAAAIISSNLSVALDTHSWTWINHLAYWLSCASFILFAIVYSLLPGVYTVKGLVYEQFNDIMFYIGLVLCVVVSLGPRFIIYYARRVFKPSDSNIMQEIQHLLDTGKITLDSMAKESPFSQRRSTYSSNAEPSGLHRRQSNASFHSIAYSMETGVVTTPSGFSFSHTLGMGNVILRSPLSIIQNQITRLGAAASTKTAKRRQKSNNPQSRPPSAPSGHAAQSLAASSAVHPQLPSAGSATTGNGAQSVTAPKSSSRLKNITLPKIRIKGGLDSAGTGSSRETHSIASSDPSTMAPTSSIPPARPDSADKRPQQESSATGQQKPEAVIDTVPTSNRAAEDSSRSRQLLSPGDNEISITLTSPSPALSRSEGDASRENKNERDGKLE